MGDRSYNESARSWVKGASEHSQFSSSEHDGLASVTTLQQAVSRWLSGKPRQLDWVPLPRIMALSF